ncbi:MAG: S26 family signal peptidase [Parvularculaceae bacterium]
MRPRRFLLILVAVSVAALGVASRCDFAPVLVWNASASAPIGLYRIHDRAPKIGDFVLISPGTELERFISDRRYLPPEIPLVKRVAALSGAEICREDEAVLIDKNHVADALLFDSRGRKLPVWSGCFILQSDEMFLLNTPQKSLDGRYFGATKLDDVIGVAVPVLIRGESR